MIKCIMACEACNELLSPEDRPNICLDCYIKSLLLQEEVKEAIVDSINEELELARTENNCRSE